ncbi:MAG: flavodoxin domain-containing protein, partial [Candidatus Thermoplasmatota archaeon]
MKVLVVYHSRTGNTKSVAEAIAEGMRNKGL